MLSLFRPVASLVFKQREACVDNKVFRLHYIFTSGILVLFAISHTAKEYILGDPLVCMADKTTPDNELKVIQSYCWTVSTYSLKSYFKLPYSILAVYPGVGSAILKDSRYHNYTVDLDKKYHTYYQWTSIFLLFLSICFYFPRFLWKNLEKGKIKMITQKIGTVWEKKKTPKRKSSTAKRSGSTGKNTDIDEIDDESLIESPNLTIGKRKSRNSLYKGNIEGDKGSPLLESHVDTNLEIVAHYVIMHRGQNVLYAYGFFFCELCNVLVVIFSFHVTNLLLDGQFRGYGSAVLKYQSLQDAWSVTDPMTVLFPKLAKCDFLRHGAGGNVQQVDVLCVLPVNNLNDKIFLFLWFYFLILGGIGILAVLFRLLTLLLPVRVWTLKTHSEGADHEKNVRGICSYFSLSDWFLLHQLSKNIDHLLFVDLVEAIAIEIETVEV